MIFAAATVFRNHDISLCFAFDLICFMLLTRSINLLFLCFKFYYNKLQFGIVNLYQNMSMPKIWY